MRQETIARVGRCSIDVTWRTTWDAVIVESNDGHRGVGEWSDAGARQLSRPFFDAAAASLAGRSVHEALLHVEREAAAVVASDLPSRPRRERLTVWAGFDAALCDLAARMAGEPLATWVGVQPPAAPIPCYANINRAIRERTESMFTNAAKEAVAAGFAAIKCAPFDFLVGSRRLTAGLALANAVRDAVGPDVDVMIDLHGLLTPDEIVSIKGPLVDLAPRWLEDVAPLGDVAAHRRLRDELAVPFAGGEFASDTAELRPLLSAGLLDVVMPDVKHAGGLRRAITLARYAADHGVEVSPHNPTGPVGTAHSAILAGATPTCRVLEIAVQETDRRTSTVTPREVCPGRLHPVTGEGIGLALADELVREASWTTL